MALKEWAKQFKRQTLTVYFAARDPRTPLIVRVLALAVAAYALSPVDLIPDFVPVIGLLDDLIVIPLGLALVIRFIPEEVARSAREKAAEAAVRPVSYCAAIFIFVLWIATATALAVWALNLARF